MSVLIAASPFWTGGGVDVRPGPHEAQLKLDGNRVQLPNPRGDRPIVGSPGTGSQQIPFTPIVSCRDDEAIGIYGCRNVEPGQPGDDDPELTPGDVLRAVRQIGLPSLQVRVEPGEATLVNVPTNFYAEPQPFERSVTLLGFDVDVVATPVSFQWIHGDGSTRTTTRAGRPYPALDVTHQYAEPAVDVQTRVDVTYQVRFRVDGGTWQTIGQTLLATGPTSVLDVDEAAPVLTRP